MALTLTCCCRCIQATTSDKGHYTSRHDSIDVDDLFQLPYSNTAPPLLIGCAGWNLPKAETAHFPAEGSHLERYASVLPAVEINSSFYRPHRPETYARWKNSVPPAFRFSVKVPKKITHELRLRDFRAPLDTFLAEATSLGEKLGCLLVQLPPSLRFSAGVAKEFFESLRSLTSAQVAFEPRHASWFTEEVEDLLNDLQIARVAADPEPVSGAAVPAGWRGMSYYRLHGSPEIYYSTYTKDFLSSIADRIREDLESQRQVWCIFDNTALGAATRNALELQDRLHKQPLAQSSP